MTRKGINLPNHHGARVRLAGWSEFCLSKQSFIYVYDLIQTQDILSKASNYISIVSSFYKLNVIFYLIKFDPLTFILEELNILLT